MISSFYKEKDQFISRDEVKDGVSRLDGFALIEWIGKSNPKKYYSCCVWWDSFAEFDLEEFKIELKTCGEKFLPFKKDCI